MHAVLGVDIVAFSTLDDADQVVAIETLLGWVEDALSFNGIKGGDYRWSPAGDGGYVTFTSDAGCRCGIDVAFSIAHKAQTSRRRPQSGPKISITMALHSGTVTEARELGRNRNIWGTGINTTARILSLALPGQLLVSKQYFASYIRGKRDGEFDTGAIQWRTVKHGLQVQVLNANKHDLCLTHREAIARRWQVIGSLWRRTAGEYASLIDDAMKSGEPIAALAAAKFLLELKNPGPVEELCRMIGRTDNRPLASYPHQTHYLFSLMPPDILQRVVEAASPRLVDAGTILCRKGDTADSCFFPIAGTLVVDVPGQEDAITIEPGQIVGEFGLWVSSTRRTATVRCVDECLILELGNEQFKRISRESPLVMDAVSDLIKTRILRNVLRSQRLFPITEQESEEVWAGIRRPTCEKHSRGSVLDISTWVYILFSGAVGITLPNSRTLTIPADGTFGLEQVVGIVSDIGSPDGSSAQVLEDIVAVKLLRTAMEKLQTHEAIATAWSALCGERMRVISKTAAQTAAAPSTSSAAASTVAQYDLFLSHASEDKDSVARPLYNALADLGVSVWFDEATLEIGDSLRQKIDEGLSKCRYGVVILSPSFLKKQWPSRELDGLYARETASGAKAILPVWHELDAQIVLQHSPLLAERLAARSEEGVDVVAEKLLRVLRKK